MVLTVKEVVIDKWKYWVPFLGLNFALFELSFDIREEVYSHNEGALTFWILPLIGAGFPIFLLIRSEGIFAKIFWATCFFGMLFWSRVFYEITFMEPCFGNVCPRIAFWMMQYYHPDL